MRKLITGWDIDGVGFNFGDSFHNYLKHIGQEHLWKSGPTSKPFWNWYEDWGWTTEEFMGHCHEAADLGILFSGPVRDGYKEAIDTVAALGHEIVIVTDRPFGTTPVVSHELTKAWLEEHGIKYDQLAFSANKESVPTHTFIDDKISNYDALVLNGTAAFLLNRPWNEQSDARRRIDSIEEYVEAIESIGDVGEYDMQLA